MAEQPRIFFMGNEISLDDLPSATEPVDAKDYFANVTLSARSIDEASRFDGEHRLAKAHIGVHSTELPSVRK